jgi:DNA invertase Pin-like site-specific DNA recombinase
MGRRSTVSLSSFAERVAKVFREKASGTQADRRQLLRLIKAVARGDVVIVTRIDRAARSLDL